MTVLDDRAAAAFPGEGARALPRRGQGTRRHLRLALGLLGASLLVAIPLRAPFLRAAGRALVAEDGLLVPADMIVVTTAAGGAGVLEAADLVQAGVAPRVAFFTGPEDEADRELLRRGVRLEDDGERSVRELRALGVTAVEEIERPVSGSEDEGRALPLWCDQRHLRAVVVVTTSDHSRRLRRLLHRSMRGHETRIAVRSARHSEFDPEGWWHSRAGTRIGVIEIEKLLLDVALHPLS